MAWQSHPCLVLCTVSLGGKVAEPCLGLLTCSFHSLIHPFLNVKSLTMYILGPGRGHIFCKAIQPPQETRPPYGEHSVGMYPAVAVL